MIPTAPPSRSKIHGRGNRRLDDVVDLVGFAARPMPIARLLDEVPRRIAGVFAADVCSLYLLEGDGHALVMRGNVGFSHDAIGHVRLTVGEGITGQAVEYMRPISAELASDHASFKRFDELEEERFPVFLAVPIRGKSGPLGAVVVQRKAGAFDEPDIELLTALGGIVAACLRHAELIDANRDKAPPRRAGGGTRRITLPGRPMVFGRAIGAVAALRRPPQHPTSDGQSPSSGDGDVRMLRAAFDVAEKAISALAGRARQMKVGREAAFLGTHIEILGDQRFRERAAELAGQGMGLPAALGQVAREVTRTAASLTRDPFLEERAKDVEDLCDALSMLARSDKRAELPSKAVFVGDNLSVFDLLVSARAHPVGIALTDRAVGPRTATLLRLLGVPSMIGVEGLFRWASDGDVAMVDADHGLFVLNPSKSEVAALRAHRKDKEGAARPPGRQGTIDDV
jgi:phosphotransferase system, enzyme I, PtsP